MKRLMLMAALASCAPNHALRYRTTPPMWKHGVDFVAMTLGLAVGMDGYSRPTSEGSDTKMAVGFGTFLMFWLPYWVVRTDLDP